MRKNAYPKGKVELVFETSKLDPECNPVVAVAHKVPAESAKQIANYFNIMGNGEIITDEKTYTRELRLRKKDNPKAKDYLGGLHHKLGPNLGKSGIWGCKLVNQYSLDEDNPQRALFYEGHPQVKDNVSELPTPDIENASEDVQDLPYKFVEAWKTKDGNFRPNAKRIIMAINKKTGELLGQQELGEDFSTQTELAFRDRIAREYEKNLPDAA